MKTIMPMPTATVIRPPSFWPSRRLRVAFFSSSPRKAALCRILLEISLIDSAYMRSGTPHDLLTDAAKRYRVDIEKVEKAVVAEFAAKRSKEPNQRPSQETKSAT